MQCAARPVYTAPTSLSTSVITLLSSMPAHLLNVLEVERVWAGRLGSFGLSAILLESVARLGVGEKIVTRIRLPVLLKLIRCCHHLFRVSDSGFTVKFSRLPPPVRVRVRVRVCSCVHRQVDKRRSSRACAEYKRVQACAVPTQNPHSRQTMSRRVRGGGWCMWPRGVLPIQNPELSG